jgi:hypothetical protein
VVLCKTDRDCGTAQTCIPLGTCSLSDKYCTQFGALCGGEGGVPAGNTCTQIPGYCEARDICESAPYANPTVPISVLPGATPSILAALGNRKPEGLTPTGPALTGAIEHARMRQRANPQRKAAVLLASDGFPSECMPATVSGVAAIAKEGLDGNPSVPTFAVGVVSREEMATATSSLSEIAIAGGTGKPFVINTAANVTADFQAALSAIRSNSLACEYKLPMPSAGATDFTKVNVQMTRGNGSVETVVNVKDKATCDPERGGWYYDVPLGGSAQPSAILICPATCERLRAERTGQIDIVLGCRTVIE